MTAPLLTLRPGASLTISGPSELTIHVPSGHVRWRQLSAGQVAALQRLGSPGVPESEMAETVLAQDGSAAIPRLYHCLHQLRRNQLICYAALHRGEPLATLVPVTKRFVWPERSVDPKQRYMLSRFAFLRQVDGQFVVESSLSEAQVILHGAVAAGFVAGLTSPTTAVVLTGNEAPLSRDEASRLLALLLNAGFLSEVTGAGTPAEDQNPTLAQWEFHDLLFHTRTRMDRYDQPFGGTFPFLNSIPPEPAVKSPMSERVIPLFKPEMGRLAESDLPFSRVLEDRRSVRAQGAQPITLEQLGEFLYRTARVRAQFAAQPAHGHYYDTTSRPYPGGGACYELELYLSVGGCQGLDPGLYHYDPLGHRLELLRHGDETTAQISQQHAWALTERPGEPQIAIHIASRFQRVSWKYRAIAYAATLKNVGVLYQTMYLVGTAMGLATLGIGSGRADLLNNVTGLDYYAESVVGEFLLGSR